MTLSQYNAVSIGIEFEPGPGCVCLSYHSDVLRTDATSLEKTDDETPRWVVTDWAHVGNTAPTRREPDRDVQSITAHGA